MVKFTDTNGKTTMIDRAEFMRLMKALAEVARLNKEEKKKEKGEWSPFLYIKTYVHFSALKSQHPYPTFSALKF